jgi:hypothetical protein
MHRVGFISAKALFIQSPELTNVQPCRSDCPDYDLCEGCYKRGVHPAGHHMLSIVDPEESSFLKPIVCSLSPSLLLIEFNSLITGIGRYGDDCPWPARLYAQIGFFSFGSST